MIDFDKLEEKSKYIQDKIKKVNDEMLEKIGKTIKKIGELRATETHRLQQILKDSIYDVNEIIYKLQRISQLNVIDITEMLYDVAKEDYDFYEQFYKYRNIGYTPFEKNKEVQRRVKAICNQTAGRCTNLSKTTVIGLKDYKGKVKYVPLRKAYKRAVDKAIVTIQGGKASYSAVMREMLKGYADSGIRKVEYESGYSQRLDSALRQNIIDGANQINQEIQNIVGEEIGADGVEISVHSLCAPDHLPIQGHQFSNKEYEKLQSKVSFKDIKGNKFTRLKRKIGEWNCRHFAIPIILGVSKPIYTDEQLEDIRNENKKKINIQGKEYTKYEASQLQRKLETAIRHAKDRYLISKASGDIIQLNIERRKINDLNKQYKEISKKAGLSRQDERLRVEGYSKREQRILTEEEKYAIMNYISSDSYKINYMLRNGYELNENMKEVSKNLSSALTKLPDYKGIVNRSLFFDNEEETKSFISTIKNGVLNSKAFISASKEIYDERDTVRLIISSKHGKDISEFNENEQEVLFDKGTRFFVTKRYRKGNKIYMELEEL